MSVSVMSHFLDLKDSYRVQPESGETTVPGCEMKVEELEGSSEILQIKIEDVNSLGGEEKQSDQLNGESCDLHNFWWDICLLPS